jgi:hypothetical protein
MPMMPTTRNVSVKQAPASTLQCSANASLSPMMHIDSPSPPSTLETHRDTNQTSLHLNFKTPVDLQRAEHRLVSRQ